MVLRLPQVANAALAFALLLSCIQKSYAQNSSGPNSVNTNAELNLRPESEPPTAINSSDEADDDEEDEFNPLGPTQPIGHSLKLNGQEKQLEELIKFDHQNAVASQLKLPEFKALEGFKGVPRAFVNLGNAGPAYGIVVEKLHHRLTVFERAESGKYRVVKSYRAITGKKYGNKERRGDLKTPEGVYFATGKKEGRGLPSKYGVLAFILDFPNIYDRQDRKTGSGIWIHATDKPARLLTPFDTEGCVALSNADITELKQYVIPFQTPVVITKEMTTVANEDELESPRKRSLEMIEAWRHSWEKSEFDTYESFYSKNFVSLGKKKSNWITFKKSLSKIRDGEIHVTISEPKILAFEDQLLAVFYQEYRSPDKTDFGQKFLYLQWEGDRYRVIGEKWYRTGRTERALQAMRSKESAVGKSEIAQ